MDTGLELLCCREMGRVNALISDDDCITAHDMFSAAFLNVHVLQLNFELLEDRPERVQAPEIHRSDIYIRFATEPTTLNGRRVTRVSRQCSQLRTLEEPCCQSLHPGIRRRFRDVQCMFH